MDYSLPGSSVHGILQARILDWVAFTSPEDIPDQRSNLHIRWVLHWQADSLPLWEAHKSNESCAILLLKHYLNKEMVVHIYSGVLAIKRNTLESFELRWTNLEPITWSEVSHKEKNKYCIVMHIHGI